MTEYEEICCEDFRVENGDATQRSFDLRSRIEMARIFVDYVPDKIIIGELKLYHAYNAALRTGAPKNERPPLPHRRIPGESSSLRGVTAYAANSALLSISELLGMVKAQEWLARRSISTDDYSREPMSCGIHKAYTKLGLACLARNDVVTAIQSLSYSAKIHPCLHTTTYGLSHALRNRLISYPEAEDAVGLFDVIALEFSGPRYYLSVKSR